MADHLNGDDLEIDLLKVRDMVADFASTGKHRIPTTIMQSRFAPASEVVDTGMLSCGSLATLSAALLRHRGYEVALVHGRFRDNPHAWIRVRIPGKRWRPFDPSDPYSRHPEGRNYDTKLVCADWAEIKEELKDVASPS